MKVSIVSILMVVALLGCKKEQRFQQYLGAYYGGFDTAQTLDPKDDLNPNECSPNEDNNFCKLHQNPLDHLLANVDFSNEGKLTLDFYKTEEDLKAGTPMLLSKGCKTLLGPTTEYEIFDIDELKDETQLLATARFPIVHGNKMMACTGSSRVSHVNGQFMDVSLQVNPVTQARALAITVEKSRRDGDYLYVKQKEQGSFFKQRVPVELDLQTVGTDKREARRLCATDGETQLENQYGGKSVCVMTGRKKWRIGLPFGVTPDGQLGPGITMAWGSTRSPKWYRTTDEPDIVTYHRGIFLPVTFDKSQNQ